MRRPAYRRGRLIKGGFTRCLKQSGMTVLADARGEHGIWRRRFWEHTIRDDADLRHHIDYIHYNPVKHGYVSRPLDWPHSSFHRYVKRGLLASDWGVGEIAIPKGIGHE